ncbi:hypothetical protein [Streptomyces sp. N50]|uniref:hypothetical protein n=1 Tax=Streptomyces sp. N50 TaxID=3081765 RepID=UPI002962565B|nr:hypothetical protein [Streptomyces sp. N50]WOX16165.1 hypothetical protein R2B38_45845 [Streptomyces sp. N50]
MNNLASIALNNQCSTGRLVAYAILPGIGPYLMERCLRGTITARTFVYTIDPAYARNALYVPDQIRSNTDLYSHYRSQNEWAYVRHIPNWAITGARIYTMTARYNRGFLVPSTITFQYDQFVANPHHAQTRITYDPATDRHGPQLAHRERLFAWVQLDQQVPERQLSDGFPSGAGGTVTRGPRAAWRKRLPHGWSRGPGCLIRWLPARR